MGETPPQPEMMQQAASSRDRAREVLLASESRYRRLFETALDGILLLNADTAQIEDVNPYLIKMLGYSHAEFLGKKLWEVGPFADAAQSKKMFAELQTKGHVRYEDLPLKTIDGKRIDVEFVSNTYDCDGIKVIQCNIRNITERKAAERELHAREQRYKAVTTSATDAFVTSDATGRIVGWNPSAGRIFGYAEADVIGQALTLLLPQRVLRRHPDGMAPAFTGSERGIIGKTVERTGRRKDGSEFPLELSLAEWAVGDSQFFTAIIRDVTESKAAEARIQRQTKLYAALSQCNKAIVHCACEKELFPKVCRAAVLFGGMKMAWIGIIDPETHLVRPSASFGDDAAHLKDITVSVDAGNRFGRGPIGAAIREDRPCWCQDFLNDPSTSPWLEHGERAGFAALAALPLHRNGEVVGAFCLYSGVANSFDEPAQDLLAEMATDISFALDNFTRESRRRKAEEQLQAAEEKFRGLVEQAIAGIFILQNGKLVYVNPRGAEIIGHGSPDDLIGADPFGWVAEADRDRVEETLRRLRDGEVTSAAFDFAALRRDGTTIDLGANATRAHHDGAPAIIGMLKDVSAQKRADEEILRHVGQLKTALNSTVEVATIISEMRDPYTAGHERRVAEIAAVIGAELGLDADRQEGLRVAGHLHDIGKMTVPAEILSKPGKLRPAEYSLIQDHAQASYDVLKGVEFPWPVAQVALQHHERMDGSGYPNGLKGNAILFDSRIMAVADVVEAMSSHRPYRPGLGIEMALAEIERGAGTLYDQAVADACLCLFREKRYQLPA